MKETLAAKALRGFFILLPFLIAYLMVGQLVDMLLALTQPLIDVMPGVIFETEGWRRVVAFGQLIAMVLVAQFADTRLARAFGSWFERAIMGKFAPYAVLKSLSARLSGEDDDKLQPALMTVGPTPGCSWPSSRSWRTATSPCSCPWLLHRRSGISRSSAPRSWTGWNAPCPTPSAGRSTGAWEPRPSWVRRLPDSMERSTAPALPGTRDAK